MSPSALLHSPLGVRGKSTSCSDPSALNGEIFKLISPPSLDHCSVQQLGMTPGSIQNVTLYEPG